MNAQKLLILLFIATGFILGGCIGAPTQLRSQDVTVAPIGSGDTVKKTNIKRDQLAEEIRRFADRYAGRMSIESDRILDKATTPELRWFASGWNLGSQRTALAIAIGPNAVENLLDLLVFTSLTRIEVENYYVPKYLGDELGEGLLRASKQLDAEAWELSAQVLTPEQQDELRALIAEWKEANPDQHYFWFVRFSGFSGQRAEDLERVQQTGGLLAEVQMTRETAEELQEFSERLLYYLQRAPAITRIEATLGMREMLRSPEVVKLLEDTHRVSRSSERYAKLAEHLPAESTAAIDHLFDRLSKERQSSIDQLYTRLSEERIAAIDYFANREREVFSDTLVSLSEKSESIATTSFIRAIILILFAGVVYLASKLAYNHIQYRIEKSRKSV